MSGWTKLFASITESSVWCADDKTLRVWVALLARCNAEGIVEGSIPGFANLCRMTIEDFEIRISNLSQPDPYSRTKTNEGRRIEEVPGGWKVLNYLAFRDKGQYKDGSRANYYRQYRRNVARNNSTVANVTRTQDTDTDTDNTPPAPSNGAGGADGSGATNGSLAAASPSLQAFSEFWERWPKKKARSEAEKAWRKIPASLVPVILADVASRCRGDPDWLKEEGRYIPNPATYLNGRRWEDQGISVAKPREMTDDEIVKAAL